MEYTLYVNKRQFQELAGGSEHLEDLTTNCPSRNISEAVPTTLNGIVDLGEYRKSGVTRIVDP